jgi:hypothetical protein
VNPKKHPAGWIGTTGLLFPMFAALSADDRCDTTVSAAAPEAPDHSPVNKCRTYECLDINPGNGKSQTITVELRWLQSTGKAGPIHASAGGDQARGHHAAGQ